MSEIWDKLIACEQKIIEKCASLGVEQFDDPEFDWLNRVFKGEHFRRAHIDSVDARATKGLYMTHICVFPNFDNDAPIYGFDIIAGKKKVTGAFHDYSPTIDWNHPLCNLFRDCVQNLEWRKERELPDWAKAIFSGHMIAVGNVNTSEEMDQVVEIALDNLFTSSFSFVITFTIFFLDNNPTFSILQAKVETFDFFSIVLVIRLLISFISSIGSSP